MTPLFAVGVTKAIKVVPPAAAAGAVIAQSIIEDLPWPADVGFAAVVAFVLWRWGGYQLEQNRKTINRLETSKDAAEDRAEAAELDVGDLLVYTTDLRIVAINAGVSATDLPPLPELRSRPFP